MGVRNTKFHRAHFPTGGRTQVHRLRQFHREIGVNILFVDVARGVAEESNVKVASSSHTL